MAPTLFGERYEEIVLVVLDVVMPKRDGREVCDEARRIGEKSVDNAASTGKNRTGLVGRFRGCKYRLFDAG